MNHWVPFLGVYFGGRGLQISLIIRRRCTPYWWCRRPFTHKHATQWKAPWYQTRSKR